MSGIDTSRTYRIEKSVTKLGLALVGALLFVAAGWWMVNNPDPTTDGRDPVFWGWVGIVFFGLGAAMLCWRMLLLDRSVVTLTPQGLTDLRLARSEIPWRSIRDIRTKRDDGKFPMLWLEKVSMTRKLCLELDPALKPDLTCLIKLMRQFNASVGGCGLPMMSTDLAISFAELNNLVHAFWRAHGPEQRHDGLVPSSETRGA